jgi:hypothetical protein
VQRLAAADDPATLADLLADGDADAEAEADLLAAADLDLDDELAEPPQQHRPRW